MTVLPPNNRTTFPTRADTTTGLARTTAAAFSLVEVTLALGISSFCLVAVFGLLPIGVNTNRTSLEQVTAGALAANIVADLRGTTLVNPAVNQTSAFYRLAIPAAPGFAVSSANIATLFLRADGSPSSNGTATVQDAHYRATVYYTSTAPAASGASATRNAVAVRVWITWPAVADGNPSSTPSNYSGSFEAFTTLLRN